MADGGSASWGFKNLTGSSAVYTHDLAGNLTLDPKKGVGIVYNVLNKTERITINSYAGRFINYTYDGFGVLLRKQQYDNNVLQKTTDYIDGFVYENSTLAYFWMAEGRVRNTVSGLKPEYVITDYQGNARVSFEEQNGQAVVRQENSYYPFGLVMPGGLLPTESNRQLYNVGSEWQNDFADLPDYFSTFYRNYDAALGRFIAVAPLAQENESVSPFNYGLNNPICFNDPMGDKQRDAVDAINDLLASAFGGTWSAGGGGSYTLFVNRLEAFGAADEYLNAHNGWGNTLGGDFHTGYVNVINESVAEEKGADGTASREVDIGETRTNKNWLIERLDEANQVGGWGYTHAALAASGVLVADDVTGIGVINDIAIPPYRCYRSCS